MSFLSITGFGALEVDSGGANEGEPEEGGEDVRAFAGNLRSVVSWTRRQWEFTTGWLTQADYNSLKAVCANGAQIVCSGDALDNAGITCRVRVHGGPYIDLAGTGFSRQARLTIFEV